MKVQCFDDKTNTREVEIEQSELSICRICGFDNVDYFPWGEDGHCPEYAYCDCCGVESGYPDYSIKSIHIFREKWISNGAIWDRPEKQPEGWSLEESLAQIPKAFK